MKELRRLANEVGLRPHDRMVSAEFIQLLGGVFEDMLPVNGLPIGSNRQGELRVYADKDPAWRIRFHPASIEDRHVGVPIQRGDYVRDGFLPPAKAAAEAFLTGAKQLGGPHEEDANELGRILAIIRQPSEYQPK